MSTNRTSSRTVIGSAGQATSSVFDTIGTAATQITGIISVLGTGVDMLETYVQDARKDQLDRSKIHRATFREHLLQDTKLELATRELQLQRELESDSDLFEAYKSMDEKLKNIFD